MIYSDLMGYYSDHRKKMDEIYDLFPNDLLMGILSMSLISSTELSAHLVVIVLRWTSSHQCMVMSWWAH